MEHNYIKVWLHVVFATKYRRPMITSGIEASVHEFLHEQVADMDCKVVALNGTEDHIHILFALNPDRSISDIMKHIKGGSSFKINRKLELSEKFQWQAGYGCFTVGQSGLDRVKQYIDRQKIHHRTVSTLDELSYFRNLAGRVLTRPNPDHENES